MTRVIEPRKPSKDSEKSVVHDVKKGETLSSIARKHGTSPEAIAKANGLKNPNALSIGQDLKIPGSKTLREEARKDVASGPSKVPDRTPSTSSGKLHSTLREFERDVLGTPYKTPAPFCRTKPEADQKRYDCLTLVLKYLGEKGVDFDSGRTDRGDKVLSDHLKPYAHITLSNDHKGLVCTDKKSGEAVKRDAIKEGDVVLIGHKYSKAEGGFSVYHLGIVKYERDDKGAIKKGADGEPLLYMIHANSTGRYGQDREVVVTGIRRYLAQRADDPKRSESNRSHYSEILVCRVKPDSMDPSSRSMLATK